MTEPKNEPTKLDPILSEFATQEEADEYDAWLDREIDESLDDPRPSVPHEQVVQQIDEIIRVAKDRHQRKAE